MAEQTTPICDFCSAPMPAWVHPSADFTLPEDGWGSASGAWAACETCHALIEAEDKEGLLNRAMSTYVPAKLVNREERRRIKDRMRRMHGGFWRGRNGTPYRDGLVREGQHRTEGSA